MAKILLIDDDRTLLDMYQEFLVHAGNLVDTAQNGPDGINKALTNSYEIILLDVMMPNMDGMQVLAKLKQDQRTAPVPVLFLSNVADEKYILASKASGAAGYIVKTDFDLDEILTQINNVLEPRQANYPPPNDKV